MGIALIGLSHKTAPIELRERLHIAEDQLSEALQQLKQIAAEGMIFSTCNRFEVLVHEESAIEETLVQFISRHRNVPRAEFEPFLYRHAGPEAVRHVFRVVASLDSMVVGEAQILGQMKQFFSIARQQKTIGSLLNLMMERAFNVAKKVRTETMIAANAVSISSVAVELASKIFGRVEGKTAFIIGAGKMSLLSMKHLKARGIKKILVTNRTFQKAAEIAESIQGRAVPFETLPDCLGESDIVISSTGSTNFIVKKEDLERAMTVRKNRPMFLIDIAVPRDIDPQINQVNNVFLYDIDDLKTVADQNRKERLKEAEKAEALVMAEAEAFWSKVKTLEVTPTIQEIKARMAELSKHEIELTLKKMGPTTPEQREAIERLAASLTQKIVQSSFSELRSLANQPDGLDKIELIKKLFRL
ncbi:MAG TPA: glutamyl-tRNA reductase [Acidobacteriota bacterium]